MQNLGVTDSSRLIYLHRCIIQLQFMLRQKLIMDIIPQFFLIHHHQMFMIILSQVMPNLPMEDP